MKVMPRGWSKLPLKDTLASLELGGNYANSLRPSEYPLMKMGNLERGVFNLSKIEFVPESEPPSEKHLLREGDVLFNTRNTLDLVGKVAIWKGELQHAYFNSNLLRLNFDPSKIASNYFANYSLNTWDSIASLRSLATGTTSVAAIYTRDLMTLPILVPPLKEQQAIAEVLSDADALIKGLERLIAKKRLIKQGAMQDLLTAKRRLPGFSGEWNVSRVGLKVRMQVGFPFPSTGFTEQEMGPRLIRNRDLRSNSDPIYFSGDYSDAYLVNPGEVLIGMDGDFLPAIWSGGIALLNQRVGRLVGIGLNHVSFFYFRLQSELSRIESQTTGTTVKHLSHSDVESIEIPIPEPDEQAAITDVLVDMDAEIQALETRLEKARQIKEGMMQNLLTGRIRLV